MPGPAEGVGQLPWDGGGISWAQGLVPPAPFCLGIWRSEHGEVICFRPQRVTGAGLIGENL